MKVLFLLFSLFLIGTLGQELECGFHSSCTSCLSSQNDSLLNLCKWCGDADYSGCFNANETRACININFSQGQCPKEEKKLAYKLGAIFAVVFTVILCVCIVLVIFCVVLTFCIHCLSAFCCPKLKQKKKTAYRKNQVQYEHSINQTPTQRKPSDKTPLLSHPKSPTITTFQPRTDTSLVKSKKELKVKKKLEKELKKKEKESLKKNEKECLKKEKLKEGELKEAPNNSVHIIPEINDIHQAQSHQKQPWMYSGPPNESNHLENQNDESIVYVGHSLYHNSLDQQQDCPVPPSTPFENQFYFNSDISNQQFLNNNNEQTNQILSTFDPQTQYYIPPTNPEWNQDN